MASFGLSEGASWGSEGSRSRRKRPYFSPSPPHKEEEEEEEEEEGWGGPWGSLDRDERERPREEEEEEEEEGRRGRSRPGCWDPPARGGSRSPPRKRRRRRRRRGGRKKSGESPGPPSKDSAWAQEEGLHHHQYPALGRRMMDGSPTQRSSSRNSSSSRSEGDPGWEARQDQDHREREAYPRKQAGGGERRGGSDQREGSYGEEEGVWRKPSSSRSKGVPGWESKQDQDHREREAYPRREGRSGERRGGSGQSEGSYGEWDGGQSSSRSKERSGWEAKQDQDHREREAYPQKEGRSGERWRGSGEREGSYGEEEGVWKKPSSSRSKGASGWEAKQDQDHREREAYPRKQAGSGERQSGFYQREGSYDGREGGRSSPRSMRRSEWEVVQDQDYRERVPYPKKGARSGERQRGPETMEGGFLSYARGEEGWSSSSRRREQGGPSWGDPKWKEGREDSPRYRDQSRFDSDLRGIDWDSPERKRREYERPTTSGKGREMRHSSSEDLEDWGSSTGYLEERSVEEDQLVRKSLQGGSGGPEGRSKLYTGPDKRVVGPGRWVPRKEVVEYWNQCQSVLQRNVQNGLLSTCPRPTLPDKSTKLPVLNQSVRALMTAEQARDVKLSSYFLWLTHVELLNMLGPVMAIHEMAEESIEKREAVDPLELREWAQRIIRYMGSINQRLKLQHCSQVLKTFHPRLREMTTKLGSWRANGLLFAEDRVQLLQKLISDFSTLDNQSRGVSARHDGDQKPGPKKLASHPWDGAAQLTEPVSDLKDGIRSFPEVENQTRNMNARNGGDQKLNSKKLRSRPWGGDVQLIEQFSAPGAKTDQGVSLELWHRRFGHREEKAIRELQSRHLGLGLLINDADAGGTAKCAVCLRVKRPASAPLPKMQRSSGEMLDLIHGVLHGPFPEPSHQHHRYALIFVDDYSRYCFTYILKDEGEIQEVLAKYLVSLDKCFQRKPKVFQMEKGAASFSQSSRTFLEEQGILYRAWGRHPAQEARTAVMEMSCLLEMTRCMLEDAALPAKFWNHAFMMASYLLNILPVEGCSRTPFELWRGKVPQMRHLWVFGSLAYAPVFRGRRQNLDSSIEETVLLGYGSGKKQYKVMSLKTGEVLQRDVYYIVEEKTADPKGTASDPSGAQNRSVDPLLSAVASRPSPPVSHRMLEEDGIEGEPCPQREEGDWW